MKSAVFKNGKTFLVEEQHAGTSENGIVEHLITCGVFEGERLIGTVTHIARGWIEGGAYNFRTTRYEDDERIVWADVATAKQAILRHARKIEKEVRKILG